MRDRLRAAGVILMVGFAGIAMLIGLVAAAESLPPDQPISQIVTITRPITPKVVRHRWCNMFHAVDSDPILDDYVKDCIQQGYKITIISIYEEQGEAYVVAEKY